MAILRLKIRGQPGTISVDSFLRIAQSSFGILRDIDTALSKERRGSIQWLVSDLSTGSLVLEIRSCSKMKSQDFASQVVKSFVQGFAQIEREGSTPPYWPERRMLQARQLLRTIGKDGVAGIVLSGFDADVDITAQSVANIDQLLKVRYRSIGSVEGRVETISVHGTDHCILYHGRTMKAITCILESRDMLDEAYRVMGKRVIVTGKLESNFKGEPLRIEVQGLRALRSKEELPSIADIGGIDPDFTGELTTEEYIRGMRVG